MTTKTPISRVERLLYLIGIEQSEIDKFRNGTSVCSSSLRVFGLDGRPSAVL